MMMLYATIDTNADYILHFTGTMGTFNVVSFEKFILDEEIVGYVNRILRGINVTDETLRFDEIAKVGPRGTFLYGRTPKIYREEVYLSKLFNKEDAGSWQSAGAKSIKTAAREEVEKRIASYQPPERTKEQDSIIGELLPPMYRDNI